MRLKSIELVGFKSFAKKTKLFFDVPICAIVGPNGSGKSNVVEAFRFVLGEQSIKSMRGGSGTDLIFKGTTGATQASRAAVSVTFDNHDNIFSLSLDSGTLDISTPEVVVSREVVASGENKYSINGHNVRLRDVVELLSSVSIGQSGHHIISQGEADRMLSSSARERRFMIEDALGLKIFLNRIKESERKIEKSLDNLKEVELKRKENRPTIESLRKQVERIRESDAYREDLKNIFSKYYNTEKQFLNHNKKEENSKIKLCDDEIKSIKFLAENQNTTVEVASGKSDILKAKNQQLSELRAEQNLLERKISHIDGTLDFIKNSKDKHEIVKINKDDIYPIYERLNTLFSDNDNWQTSKVNVSLGTARAYLVNMENILGKDVNDDNIASKIDALELEKNNLLAKLKNISENELVVKREIESLENVINQEMQDYRTSISGVYENKIKLSKIENEKYQIIKNISDIDYKLSKLEELYKSVATFGVIVTFENIADTYLPEIQEKKLRDINRLCVKLEDIPTGSQEIMKNYDDLKSQDDFYAREVEDIKGTIENLISTKYELKKQVDETFNQGVKKISDLYDIYLKKIFNGASGYLSLVSKVVNEDEEETEGSTVNGVEIAVSFAAKKIKDINMLSGGERSMVSICILFAIAEYTNPPFVILDETDAALDEANSGRYGKLLVELSKRSQLIVVTHNRETMSVADVLYGVTHDREGTSKLLSIKFEEGLEYAK